MERIGKPHGFDLREIGAQRAQFCQEFRMIAESNRTGIHTMSCQPAVPELADLFGDGVAYGSPGAHVEIYTATFQHTPKLTQGFTPGGNQMHDVYSQHGIKMCTGKGEQTRVGLDDWGGSEF